MNEVRFRDLPATNAHRCSVMLENRMQCTERASVGIAPEPDKVISNNRYDETYICRHHFVVERSLNEAEGTKYIAYDVQGKSY